MYHKANEYKSRGWQICVCALLLAGCQVGPRYEPPEMDIPEDWHSHFSEGMHVGAPDYFLWWESLNDPLLNALIQRAARQNLNLYLAAARILEARAEKKGKSAELYPHIDGSVSGGHFYCGKNILNQVLGSACHKNHQRFSSINKNFFEIGFDADWEFDLFGANTHEMNALEAKIEASEEEFYGVWVSLSAEIARNYIELRGLQQRLELIKKNIFSQKDLLHLTEELLNAGMTSMIDMRQAEEQLNSLTAGKPLLELSIDKAIHRLSILLGYAPHQLFCELRAPQSFPALPHEKPIGIPSDLLRRRPDIRKAERNLAAATEQIGSAVASLFPRLSLRGFVGDISTHLSSLGSLANGTYLVGPQLLLPIFNSTMLRQDVNYSKIKTQEALFEYQKTVLEALEETENAIASFHYEKERNFYLAQTQKSAQEAYQLMLQLYQKGFKNYLEVLVTYRSLLEVEDAYIQSRVDLLLHYIALYKALGGGWDVLNCLIE